MSPDAVKIKCPTLPNFAHALSMKLPSQKGTFQKAVPSNSKASSINIQPPTLRRVSLYKDAVGTTADTRLPAGRCGPLRCSRFPLLRDPVSVDDAIFLPVRGGRVLSSGTSHIEDRFRERIPRSGPQWRKAASARRDLASKAIAVLPNSNVSLHLKAMLWL